MDDNDVLANEIKSISMFLAFSKEFGSVNEVPLFLKDSINEFNKMFISDTDDTTKDKIPMINVETTNIEKGYILDRG